MTLSTTVVVHPDVSLHDPSAEIWVGVRTPGTEVAARAEVIRSACVRAGAQLVEATSHDDTDLLSVHEPELVEHLRTIWADWEAAGYPSEHGADRVVPYVFPTPGLVAGLPLRSPAALHARAGLYCYDTMTLVGPGTWEAARGAVDAALTAVDVVIGGSRSAYALCRPPGHHVTRSAHGGSCYLNNAAVAAAALRGAGHQRVAVLDIDAHHGNGTQAIFYDRGDVLYASAHVDPGAGWFPHYMGFADEVGVGDGLGATRNLPLALGAGDDEWLGAVASLAEAVTEHRSTALVVSLGVDAAAVDPESPLTVTVNGYQRTGELLAALGLPTVLVQEGGYDLSSLGELVVATLTAF